ncbi:MAG: phage holin family protein [Flavobacteriaceae bacterium]|jgi:putative membrane protein|nr:phage holin family protein [Flavobacteriaceae bacterium]
MKWILKLLLTALAVLLLANILPGVDVKSYTYAIWVALVIGLLNAFLRPLLIFLTLPATLITLGLFLFVINACIILIAAKFLGGFTVTSFWWALLFSLMLTFLQSFLHSALNEDNQS